MRCNAKRDDGVEEAELNHTVKLWGEKVVHTTRPVAKATFSIRAIRGPEGPRFHRSESDYFALFWGAAVSCESDSSAAAPVWRTAGYFIESHFSRPPSMIFTLV